MNRSIRLPAPAKLNLFLHILGQRQDGYHELETVFQILDWGDKLEFELADTLELKQFPPADFPDEDNLVVRAAKKLQDFSGCSLGARIKLHKQIPVGAGLGGGSSDAATALLGLNALWNLELSIEQLAELGLSLGADVPVFVRGKTALACGIGEQLYPLELEKHWFLVVTPLIHISTASIFGHPELTRNGESIVDSQESRLTCVGRNSKIRALADLAARNDCQTVAEKLHPEVARMRQALENFGSVRMSGTGSSLFMQFSDIAKAEHVLDNLRANTSIKANEYKAFVAQGVNQSAVHTELADCQTS
jgi:4-diphosphocytidyl-2-C-methyl-D-erythritol kinase